MTDTCNPVVDHIFPRRRHDRFGMKLKASNRITAVTDSHDQTLVICGCRQQFFGTTFPLNDPGMVVSDRTSILDTSEQHLLRVDNKERRPMPVKRLSKPCQPRTEHFGNGLMAETNTEYRCMPVCFLNQPTEFAGLSGKSRAGRKQDTLIAGDTLRNNAIVPDNIVRAMPVFFDHLHKIIHKRIVIVDNQQMFRFYRFHCAKVKLKRLQVQVFSIFLQHEKSGRSHSDDESGRG